MTRPLVYVLVINWNGLQHLETCFGSLCASSYPNARFLLIDNASSDGSVRYVQERFGSDPRVECLELPENRGWSGGNNEGIRYAVERGAEYLLLLNNDTWTDPQCLSRLVERAQALPKAAMLAPKMVLFDAPSLLNSLGLECSIIGSSWDRAIGRVDTGAWDVPVQTVGVCGGAMFIRAAALAATGLLPEEFEIYLDDLDLCLRVRNAGHEIWTCPEAVAGHKFSASFGEGPRARHKYFLNTRNRFWLLLRNFPLRRLPEVLPAVALGEMRALGRVVLDGEWWRVRAHLRAWRAALAYLPAAIRHRRRYPASPCKFWHLILRRPHFCPAVVFPKNGWYSEQPAQGRSWRVMSRSALLQVTGGKLRVSHTNCYPALGETRVRLFLNGQEIAHLATASTLETLLTIPAPGQLRLEAERLFLKEQTGEAMDIGGWFAFEGAAGAPGT